MDYSSDGNWHRSFLAVLAARMRPNLYVEFGLAQSPALLAISWYFERCVGVDVAPYHGPTPKNTTIYQMTTRQFCEDVLPNLPLVELAFIDADHKFESAIEDAVGLATHCAENAILVFHDTFPMDEAETGPGFCGDSYRVPAALGWENVTLPCPPGLTIARVNPKLRF